MNKELRPVVKALEDQGFTVVQSTRNHYKVYNAKGRLVGTLASTPSDVRSMRNAIAYLRKAGFEWPPKRR